MLYTPHQPIGHVGLRSGITTGAIDKFKVTLTGVGTHASAPQNVEDPIATLGYEITELQSLISRELDPFTASVLSITHLSAGNTWNVIPSNAFFEGTVRTADKNVRPEIKDLFLKLLIIQLWHITLKLILTSTPEIHPLITIQH